MLLSVKLKLQTFWLMCALIFVNMQANIALNLGHKTNNIVLKAKYLQES